jgi:hypothetical protein
MRQKAQFIDGAFYRRQLFAAFRFRTGCRRVCARRERHSGNDVALGAPEQEIYLRSLRGRRLKRLAVARDLTL